MAQLFPPTGDQVTMLREIVEQIGPKGQSQGTAATSPRETYSFYQNSNLRISVMCSQDLFQNSSDTLIPHKLTLNLICEEM